MTDKLNASEDPKINRKQFNRDSNEVKNNALVYHEGIEYFRDHGYILEPSFTGPHAYHHIYRFAKPTALQGLKFPRDFRIKKNVLTRSEIQLLQQLVKTYIEESGNKFWLPLLSPDPKKLAPLYAYAGLLCRVNNQAQKQDADALLELGIDTEPRTPLDGESKLALAPSAFIPRREWFLSQVQQLTLADILTILPPAEQELFALILGRAVVGPSDQITPSGNEIYHTARFCAILNSKPGLGKSFLLNTLIKALSWAGYTSGTFRDLGYRFGLGAVATNHIIYKDDCVEDTFKRFVKSEETKIIVTGKGDLEVEDKHKDTYNIRATGTIFLNVNGVNPRIVYSADPGTLDRLKLLTCRYKADLKELKLPGISANSPDLLPERHLAWLADQLSVDPLVIMLWLARLSADAFLEAIEFKDGINQLEQRVNYLSTRLITPFYKDATVQVMVSTLFVTLCRSVEPEDFDPSILQFNGFEWSNNFKAFFRLLNEPKARGVLYLLKYHYDNIDPSNTYHPYLGFSLIDMTWLKYAFEKPKVSEADPNWVLDFFADLKVCGGMPLAHDLVWLQAFFKDAVAQFNSVRKTYEFIKANAHKVYDKESGRIAGVAGEGKAVHLTPKTISEALEDYPKHVEEIRKALKDEN